MGQYKYPPGYSFIETYKRAIQLVNNPLESISESVERFGESYTVYTGFSDRMILTQDPEFIDYVLRKNHKNYHKSELVSKKLGRFIGNGLLSSNGAYWLRQRRLIQPGFHHQKIQGLFAIMKKTIDEFLARFPTGNRVDIYPQLNRIALEVVVNTLFDIEIPQESINDISRFVSETQEFVIRDMRQPYKSWWFSLTWTLYLLAKHPGEMEKLRQSTTALDIQQCVTHDRLNAVINESMRLYPPAWGSDRVALEDDHFKDYSWPSGTVLLLYYYGLHVSEHHWEEASAFSPDRFIHIDKEKLRNFFPFGGGPRLCIGNNFAMAEMALFLQAFIHRFDLTVTGALPKMNPLVTLRPEGVILGVNVA